MVTSTSSSGPTLAEMASAQVPSGGTIAVSGDYSDNYAAGNPGAMYLHISDASGTLSATDASGHLVAGSGTGSITLTTDYADVNAVLHSLTYRAPNSSGSDTIGFDLWNQAGQETTDTVAVTISGGGGTIDRWTGAVSSDWNNAANWSTGAVPTSGDTVQIFGKTPFNPTLSNAVLIDETIDIEGSGNGTPLLTINNVTLNSLVEGGNGARVSIGGTLTIGSHGTLLTSGNTFVLSGTAETVVNNGVIASQPNGEMIIFNSQTSNTAAATLLNNGTVSSDGGSISLVSDSSFQGAPPQWNLTNSGSVAIGDGGDLTLNGTLGGGQVMLTGAGTLELQQPQALTGGASVNGFGQGDRIELGSNLGTITAFNNGTLGVATPNGGVSEAIPLTGSYTLGNFEELADSYPNTQSQIVYAAGGSASGQLNEDIVSPASDTVAQVGTLSLADVSIQTSGTVNTTNTPTLTITAGSGTLYSPGETGSGTNQITISGQTIQQLDADLRTTSYVPAAGATSDTVTFDLGSGSYVNLLRSIPISIGGSSGGGTGPTLSEPATESVTTNATVAVSGSYSDNFAASTPGRLWLGISDSSGTLSSTDASGNAVAGSGTNSIGLSTDYVDVNAILSNLHYAAGSNGGSDTIHFDIWNQAGVETTGATAVTVDAGGMASVMSQGSSTMMADFAAPNSSGSSSTLLSGDTTSAGSSSAMLSDIGKQPTGIPLTLHS